MARSRRKRRVSQHIMEEDSFALLKAYLPSHWVIREYRPDYGLDLAIETFVQLRGSEGVFESLGEHFFIQLKSVEGIAPHSLTVRPRLNVAKCPLDQIPQEDKPKSCEIEVLSVQLDSALISTVQAMGASVVVHLFLVALEVRRIFFVCLSDYIDKIIVPSGAKRLDQETIVIHIPVVNEISRKSEHDRATGIIWFFAKRAKFYSAFNLFAYQRHELTCCDNGVSRRHMAGHFVDLLNQLDIWNDIRWPMVEDYNKWLEHLASVLPRLPDNNWLQSHPCAHFFLGGIPQSLSPEIAMDLQIMMFWNGLNVLSRNYEEICREWGLPTYLETLRMA